jgi:endonuclease/exonuclease/phosphatase family metal-dependent hydrolase
MNNMKNSSKFGKSTPFIIAFIILSSATGCDYFNTQFDDVEDAQFYQASLLNDPADDTDTLKIMTWNIKFGGARIDFFFDGWGDEVLMDEHEVIVNLDNLAAYIYQVDPDIVLLQEVDIDSKRSAYVNQLQWLLDNTDLNYGVYTSQWKADFIPSDGLGRMNSGNAIMSRWKFTEAVRIALPLISDQDGLTQYFYLKRNILRTRIDIDGDDLYVLNIHTSAFSDDDTKKKQIDRFCEELDLIDAEGSVFIAGGDMNTLPPGSLNIKEFPDAPPDPDPDYEADDFTGEEDWLVNLYDSYTSAVSLADYQAEEILGNFSSRYYTHSISKNVLWNRKLDYLFTNDEFVVGSDSTHQIGTMILSDHAPLTVKLALP